MATLQISFNFVRQLALSALRNLKKADILFVFSSYVVLLAAHFFSRGPIYIAFFFLLFIVLSFFTYRKLSIAFFQTYLYSLILGTPFYIGRDIVVQSPVVNEVITTINLNVAVPYRFVFFVFFLLSLLSYETPIKEKPSKIFFISLLSFFTLFIWVNAGELVGGHKLSYRWPTFHLLQVLLVFPTTLIFLFKNKDDKKNILLIKKMILGFILFALSTQGIFSIVQYLTHQPLGSVVESPFSNETIVAPENNLFRSPGTLGHPNFVGVFTSVLLIMGLFILVYGGRSLGSVKKAQQKLVYLSIILGLIALFLSFSRWAWLCFLFGLILIIVENRIMYSRIKKLLSRNKVIFFAVSILLFVIIGVRFTYLKTWEGRYRSMLTYFTIIGNNPIWGVGPKGSNFDLASYGYDLTKYYSSVVSAHNTLLLVAADTGVISSLLLVFFCFTLFSYTNEYLNQNHEMKNYSKSFTSFLNKSVLVGVLNTLIYPVYLFDSSLELIFILCALQVFIISNNGVLNSEKYKNSITGQ
jgi:hypothetical protein